MKTERNLKRFLDVIVCPLFQLLATSDLLLTDMADSLRHRDGKNIPLKSKHLLLAGGQLSHTIKTASYELSLSNHWHFSSIVHFLMDI